MDIQTFNEKQRTTQWWIWAVVVLVTTTFFWSFIQQIILGQPLGNKPAPDFVMYILLAIPIALILLIVSLKLITRIDDQAIFIHYIPFMRRSIPWGDISKVEVIDYHPIREFGGWGLRYGIRRRSRAYTVSGRHGLSIELKNGSKVLIGTNKPEAMKETLKVLGKS